MKSKRFLMSVLIILFWIMIGQVSYAESEPNIWDGTIEQPTETIRIDNVYYYKITKASELAYIAQTGDDWLDYNYILYNDIILNDVDLSTDETGTLINSGSTIHKWKPIIGTRDGNYIHPFEGTFDGNGHSVSGMYITSASNSGTGYLGLFGYVEGYVKNLSVENTYIDVSGGSAQMRTGGIAGLVTQGNISNCSFSGTIRGGTYSLYTGGIVGVAGMAGHVYNCINYGSLIDLRTCGGIVGYVSNATQSVKECTNYGTINGRGTLGGIVGSLNNSDIGKSVNYGSVTGSGNCIGGIAGVIAKGSINNCQNKGIVKGDTYVGGICGQATTYNNSGSGIGKSLNTAKTQGSSYVGGLIGDCDHSSVSSSFSTGIVIGESETGALLGHSTHMSGAGTVEGCYYLKTAIINAMLSGVGNGVDDEGVIMPCSLVLVEANASTCTTKGNDAYWKCTPIGTYYSDEDGLNEIEKNSWILDIDPTNHTFDNWVITKEPGCTIEGSKEAVCAECGNKLTESIEALGHDFANTFTVDTEPTCTAEGSKSRHCANCDEVTEVIAIPATGHSFSEEFTVDAEPTCTAEGSKSRHCANCDEVTEVTAIPASGHSFSEEFTVDAEPTCIAEGSKSRHCANCDAAIDVTAIPKSEHIYGEWKVTSEVTCTENGSREKVCSVCGYEVKEVIPANGHSFSEEFTVDTEPTCTAEGSKSKHCVNCDEVAEITLIPANGHSYGPWEDITASTCVNSGVQQRVCGTCGFTETQDLDPNGHSFSEEYTVDTEPTCTAEGSKSRHCKNCDAVIDSESIPAIGHKFSAWEITIKPTELAPGQQSCKCSVCDQTMTQTIAQLPPTLPAVKITKPKVAKKSATIKWEKVSKKNQKKIAKIQIQYSTDKTFKTGVKTVYAKKSATSKIITKLKSKKTYYVRIRTYKKSSGVFHISKWSVVKSMKIK